MLQLSETLILSIPKQREKLKEATQPGLHKQGVPHSNQPVAENGKTKGDHSMVQMVQPFNGASHSYQPVAENGKTNGENCASHSAKSRARHRQALQ